MLLQHATKPPPPLSSLRPDAPPALAALVDRCLAKQPAIPGRQADRRQVRSMAPDRPGT
jgi:hypothetical protein